MVFLSCLVCVFRSAFYYVIYLFAKLRIFCELSKKNRINVITIRTFNDMGNVIG